VNLDFQTYSGFSRLLGDVPHELSKYVRKAQNPLPGSKNSLQHAREWISKCRSSHKLCSTASDNFTPTRLLKIQTSGTLTSVSLIDPLPAEHVKWAALSYVWGGDQMFKTTLSSLSRMNEEFPIQRLPRTLHDACLVCRELGLEHLWVDCLCIIQDDASDLARELAVMSKIFQRAWVTISASTAFSARDGFLHNRGYEPRNNHIAIHSV
jgi:RNA polymerase subunit RPABC4/transcription elongation factor Spt4